MPVHTMASAKHIQCAFSGIYYSVLPKDPQVKVREASTYLHMSRRPLLHTVCQRIAAMSGRPVPAPDRKNDVYRRVPSGLLLPGHERSPEHQQHCLCVWRYRFACSGCRRGFGTQSAYCPDGSRILAGGADIGYSGYSSYPVGNKVVTLPCEPGYYCKRHWLSRRPIQP